MAIGVGVEYIVMIKQKMFWHTNTSSSISQPVDIEFAQPSVEAQEATSKADEKRLIPVMIVLAGNERLVIPEMSLPTWGLALIARGVLL